jgi:DNA-binding transcriptional regulator YhcF (GntR family)
MADLELVLPENDLVTVRQLAEEMGVGVDTARKRLAEAGIKPVKEAIRGGDGAGGTTPALYDIKTVRKIPVFFGKDVENFLDTRSKQVIGEVVQRAITEMDTADATAVMLMGLQQLLNKQQEEISKRDALIDKAKIEIGQWRLADVAKTWNGSSYSETRKEVDEWVQKDYAE